MVAMCAVSCLYRLQQYLPFTVLKLGSVVGLTKSFRVATVLTVYGIETLIHQVTFFFCMLQQYLPFTVLKHERYYCSVGNRYEALQQYLPFTVLKLCSRNVHIDLFFTSLLQQYLPFTVLKHIYNIMLF